jgi:hypothetical protein
MYNDKVGANSGSGGPTVCDPFDSSNVVSPTAGIKGSIYYLTANQPAINTSHDLIDIGTKVPADLFLNSINVPTRLFDTGFSSDSGSSLKNDNNDILIEWFALDLKSKIKLGSNDTPGDYQLAVISDDGSTFSILNSTSGLYETKINDEGTHPSQMACAQMTVTLDSTTRIPFDLTYYQGPRNHIARMLMWRKAPQGLTLAETECGQSGNDHFFVPATNTTAAVPTSAYNGLINRGWKPLSPENFELQSGYNRCNASGPTI